MKIVNKAVLKRSLGFGVVAGIAYAAWRAYRTQVAATPPSDGTWEAAPFPFPPIPRPRPTPAAGTTVDEAITSSVEPVDGECPVSHPVKGKVASGIYHVPGGRNYARTRADRCYLDAAAAESDGMRASKT